MSTTHFSLLAIFLLLSLDSLGTTMGGRLIPPSAPSTVTRPLVSSEVENYVKPQLNHKLKALQGREVKGCLPKGSRHNSAPSRFVNYKTLGSGGCSRIHSGKPWRCFCWMELKNFFAYGFSWSSVVETWRMRKSLMFLLCLLLAYLASRFGCDFPRLVVILKS